MNSISRIQSQKKFFFFCIVFYSQETTGRNLIVLLKNDKEVSLTRANSDFMVPDTWMSILRNFHVGFANIWFDRSCSISASLNNQMIKLTVNVTRHTNITWHSHMSRIIKSLLELTLPRCQHFSREPFGCDRR